MGLPRHKPTLEDDGPPEPVVEGIVFFVVDPDAPAQQSESRMLDLVKAGYQPAHPPVVLPDGRVFYMMTKVGWS